MKTNQAELLTTAVAADGTALQLLKLALELLDLGVGLLQILVETVTLGNELLLPLPETLLLDLDLLGKPLAESLLLLLELGVVELLGAGLAKLARLHLLCAVSLVVKLLGGVDQIQHVGADEDRSKLLEVAVVLVLNLSNTPRVLATLDNAAIAGLNILFRANDGEWHGRHQAPRMLSSSLIVLLNWRLVDLNTLSLNDGTNLDRELALMTCCKRTPVGWCLLFA